MNHNRKIISGFVAAIVTSLIFYLAFQPEGQILQGWTLEVNDPSEPGESVTMPISRRITEPGSYRFSTSFIYDDSIDALSVPRVLGYGMAIELNGHRIYELGNSEGGITANIWYSSYLISLPEAFLEAENDLSIIVFGVHDIGFTVEPTLVNYDEARAINDLRNLLTGYTVYLVIGMAIIMGALLLLISSKFHTNSNPARDFGTAFVFYAIHANEYAFRLYNGSLSGMLLLRKVFIISIVSCTFFLLKAIHRMVRQKNLPKLIWIIYGFTVLSVAIPISHGALMISSRALTTILLMAAVYMIVLIRMQPHLFEPFVMFYLMFMTIISLISYMLGLTTVISLNLAVLVFFIGLTYKLIQAFVNLNNSYDRLHFKSRQDKLTGAYNREYFEQIDPFETDTCIFIDLDKFKEFNDLHGHSEGDQLLKDFVLIAKMTIGEKGDIIRYGGDEFVIYTSDVDEDEAAMMLKAIEGSLKRLYPDCGFSYGISAVDESLEKVLKRADQRMYKMKGTNRD